MLYSKKKARVVVGVFFFLLLIVGSAAAFFLSQQNQDIRQQAMGEEEFDGDLYGTPELEEEYGDGEKGDHCSANSCGKGLACATSPFGSFCVPQEDAGDAELIDLKEEEGEAPENSLGYNSVSECNSSCGTACTGPNNRYCVVEPSLEDNKPKSCSKESDCPLGETCSGGSCVVRKEKEKNKEDKEETDSTEGYEACKASGNTHAECIHVDEKIYDDIYITKTDYEVCRENGNTHAECGGIFDHVGEEEKVAEPKEDDHIKIANVSPEYIFPYSLEKDFLSSLDFKSGLISEQESNYYLSETLNHAMNTSLSFNVADGTASYYEDTEAILDYLAGNNEIPLKFLVADGTASYYEDGEYIRGYVSGYNNDLPLKFLVADGTASYYEDTDVILDYLAGNNEIPLKFLVDDGTASYYEDTDVILDYLAGNNEIPLKFLVDDRTASYYEDGEYIRGYVSGYNNDLPLKFLVADGTASYYEDIEYIGNYLDVASSLIYENPFLKSSKK